MLSSERHHFNFFHNKEIDSLYLTLAIISFAEGLISVFVPIYFFSDLKIPLWRIIFFYFLNAAYFVALAILLLPIIKKLSDKMMMFLGIPFMILYFLGLNYVGDFPILFYILPGLLAMNMFLFNTGYHINFSSAADDGYVGREVGTRYMIGALVQFASPFIGGVIITLFGFDKIFIIGSALLLAAVLPMFFFPVRNIKNLKVAPIFDFIKDKHLRPINLSGAGYAMESVVYRFIWPIFIFLAIGNLEEFGGLISAGLLASAIVTYLVGFLSDAHRRRKILYIASSFMAFIWSFRSILATPFLVAGSHIIGNLSNASMMVAWSSQYYKVARMMESSALFILSREMIFNITRIVFLPILMLAAYFLPIEIFFTISFGAAALGSLMLIISNKMDYKLLK
ncbi:MAG TPA: hypothetical protein VI432_02165 [Candidatus Paceibacterota bacterium]